MSDSLAFINNFLRTPTILSANPQEWLRGVMTWCVWSYIFERNKLTRHLCIAVRSHCRLSLVHLFLQTVVCPVGWGCRIHQLLLCRGVRPPPHECPGYDTKQSDGEVPAVLELWGMRSTPSLSSLPGPLWPGVVAPDKGPIYGSNRTNGILITYNCLNSLK